MWMESCTRWLVPAISQGSSSTVRRVATRPAVSSAWATAAKVCRGHFGSSHFCSNLFLFARKNSFFRWSFDGKPQHPRVPGTAPQQGRWRHSSVQAQSRVVADAVADVQLEAAIAVLDGDNVHAKGLQEALRVARSKTKVPPISERVETCKTFVERAKKRVQRAQEVMDMALA